MIHRIGSGYRSACIKISCAFQSPSRATVRSVLFLTGVLLLAMGGVFGDMLGVHDAYAQRTPKSMDYSDKRLSQSVNNILTYFEGTVGALIFTCAGIGAVISASAGQYRTALSLMVIGLGVFIYRSLMSTFFNDDTVRS